MKDPMSDHPTENGPVRHFTDLKVWQRAHRLFVEVVADVERFPAKAVARILADQVIRASASIGANIAEGFASSTGREYLRYLNIAFRTTNETENWLRNMQAVGLISPEALQARLACCQEIRRMLTGLRNSLRRRATTEP